ncbi:S41 family peptidase [Hyphobacterium sp. SN044]|uniref:S41 family peptidase n=1 Tax=Hyphobacterium sp. SN044 TaxID=2912575 RepID=UPI001F17FB30|nr:S41 family peptidase [Hyphobacterium sp. SN044]MCF8880287.1 S41 family peptidase [Hyphobacterium sp. SN044]
MRSMILGAAALLLLASGGVRAQDSAALNASQRSEIVGAAADAVAENFYDSDRGAEIAAGLRNQLESGAFDDAGTVADLANALTQALRPQDNHFAVRMAPSRPQGSPDGEPGGGEAAWLAAMAQSNYGFREVSILPGNVGYIDMRSFAPAQVGGDTALAALNFVENTDAVIFDMRQNTGGAPSMVQFIISHFLDPREETVINTFVSSAREYPSELVALAWLPGESRPDVPLYVLTSVRTGSAGEAFPYHLQAMERATIVGETTYGAGNPGGFHPLPGGLEIFVSDGSARNPITGTNWEGTGVIPDVDVPADEALDAALLLAYDRILETLDDPAQRRGLEWAGEAIEARRNPVSLNGALAYEGVYGPRRVYFEDGALFYQRQGGPALRMDPLGGDRFMLEGLDDIRVVFSRDGDAVTGMTIQSLDRPDSPSPRTE